MYYSIYLNTQYFVSAVLLTAIKIKQNDRSSCCMVLTEAPIDRFVPSDCSPFRFCNVIITFPPFSLAYPDILHWLEIYPNNDQVSMAVKLLP